jgi:hypothetical protein
VPYHCAAATSCIVESSLCNIFSRYQVADGLPPPPPPPPPPAPLVLMNQYLMCQHSTTASCLFVKSSFCKIFCCCQVVAGFANLIPWISGQVPYHCATASCLYCSKLFFNIFCCCLTVAKFKSLISWISIWVLFHCATATSLYCSKFISKFATSAKLWLNSKTWSHGSEDECPTTVLMLETHIAESSLYNIFCRCQVASGFSAFFSLISSQCASTAIRLLPCLVQSSFCNISLSCQGVTRFANLISCISRWVSYHRATAAGEYWSKFYFIHFLLLPSGIWIFRLLLMNQ